MSGLLLASSNPLHHVVQHSLWTVNENGGFWAFTLLSNHILMQIIAALLLIWLLPKALRARRGTDEVGRHVPRGFGTAIESVCVGLREGIFKPNLGKYTDIFAPYLWSLFFFLLVVNILGLIPLSDWFFWAPGHIIGGTGAGNIFTTATLAIGTLILVVASGLKYNGMGYVKHFFMGPWYLSWFIGILEILGMFFKTIALCIRLFANMLAGHIVLAVLISFIGLAHANINAFAAWGVTIAAQSASILFYFLEIMVAFLHAFIFTTLTAVFLGMAVNIHHDDEHAHDRARGTGRET